MRDMTDILNIVKKVAVNAVNAQKLSDVVYGSVISVSPLRVQVDQKLILDQEHLKLTRAVKDYETEMTVNHITESATGGSGEAAFAPHTHEVNGRKKVIIHNGLTEGDKVTLIRAQGGQIYTIIDKE